jgi:sec-independent protein translocase protein TatA
MRAGYIPRFYYIFVPLIHHIMLLSTLFLIGNLGTSEIILIVLALLLLFGGKKIPELMRGIGQGVREFNNAKNSVKSQIEEGMKEQPKKEGEVK